MGNVNADLNEIKKYNFIQSANTIQDILNKFVSSTANEVNNQIKTEGVRDKAITLPKLGDDVIDKFNTEATERQSADTALGQRIDGKANMTHTHKKADITDFPATMAPTDGSVTMKKLASDVQSAIENAANAGDEKLRRDVYGRKTTTREKGIQVSPFSLSFKCTDYNHDKGVPAGTWECTDISGIYSAITVDGQQVKEHSSPSMRSDKITVTDNYLENNRWEITVFINLDPDDPDHYPVPGLSSFASEKDPAYSGVYPYVKSVTETTLRIALGYIALPDTGVQVGGAEQVLSVDGKSLTYDEIVDLGQNTNAELATEDKRSIVAAVNELAAKAQTETAERQSADTALGKRIDDEAAARETLVKEVGIQQLQCTLYGADFSDYEIGKEYLVKIVGGEDQEIGDVWFKDYVACGYTGDPSYYANRSGQEVKVGGTYALTKFSEPHRPEDDDIGEYIDGEVSFVESSVMDWAQRNVIDLDDSKADKEHTHNINDVNGLQDNLNTLSDKITDLVSGGIPDESIGAEKIEGVDFTEATKRENIKTGETLKTLFGKIKKCFSDLKPVAWSGSYNDLSDKPQLFSGSYNDLTDKPAPFTLSDGSVTSEKLANSIALRGAPTAPTVDKSTNNTQIATTEFVKNVVAASCENISTNRPLIVTGASGEPGFYQYNVLPPGSILDYVRTTWGEATFGQRHGGFNARPGTVLTLYIAIYIKDGVLYWDEYNQDEYSNRSDDERNNEVAGTWITSETVVEQGAGNSKATFNHVVDDEDLPDGNELSARDAILFLAGQIQMLWKKIDNKSGIAG